MKIKMIGNMRTGLVLSRKKHQDNSKNTQKYPLLTLKSFNVDGYIVAEDLDVFYSDENLNDSYFTKTGDIVIRLSEPNTSVCIKEAFSGYLVPSSFVIIKPQTSKILPEYLAWYLNSQFGKKQIKRSQIGSAISIITTGCLENIIIKEIDILKQQKIIEMNDLLIREKSLLTKLAEKKELYYKTLMYKICEDKFNNKGAKK